MTTIVALCRRALLALARCRNRGQPAVEERLLPQSVIPAEAGIQILRWFLDSGSPRSPSSGRPEAGPAGFGRNDDCWCIKNSFRSLLIGLAFGVAGPGLAWAQSSTAFDGQYMGQLTLTKTVSGDCTEPPPGALYPLAISGGRVEFKYVPRFDTILQGRVEENGRFTAVRRLRRGRVSMSGRIEGSNVAATISSPSCIYTFHTQ